MVTGAYDKPVAKQHGAPLRLHLPWKYGFKSIKSIRKISFVEERPVGLWEALQPSEYGFWANVNPEVPHPRWSQAMERVLHTGEMVPTQLFNGYGARSRRALHRHGPGDTLYVNAAPWHRADACSPDNKKAGSKKIRLSLIGVASKG